MRDGDTRFYAFLGGTLVAFGWIIIVVVLLGCSHHKPPKRPDGIDAYAEEQARRAVHVEVNCPDGRGGTGSGVIVGPHAVLTADHVVSRCIGASVRAILPDGTERHLDVIDRLSSHDLAMLKSSKPMPAPPIVPGRVSAGSDVCVVPGSPARVRSCGKVLIVFSRPGNMNLYFTAKVVPGNSGSGVYGPGGALVGITTHSTDKGVVNTGGSGTALWLIDPGMR